MKYAFLTVLILGSMLAASGQTVYTFTTAANREKHDRYAKDSLIVGSLRKPLSPATEKEWMKAFWAMELLLYRTAFTKEKLSEAWKETNKSSEAFQKALLEVSYTLYPHAFDRQVSVLLKATTSPAVFVRCAEYLLRSQNSAVHKAAIAQLLTQNFAGSDVPSLTILQQRLNYSPSPIPPLKDIFSSDFLPGETVIYSLQRAKRDYAGLVVIRKPDGSFLKSEDGSPFHVAQLAKAITDYPFYITNGNTPQGIFRWTGFDTSAIPYIGPTPNLQLVMPFEAPPSVFWADSTLNATLWQAEQYASLLPASWKNYRGIYESFWAGAAGRSEVIMHGTTINPAYYKGQPYFPQTPSLGCLCSYEEWDKNGKLARSHQQLIVDALNQIGSTQGYVVVIDLDNKSERVQVQEIASLLIL